jgi:hypothetical protein
MPQKQNLQRSAVRYFVKLSAITSGIILVFSIGLGIVTNNLERSKSKEVLGSTETLPETGIGDPSQPSQNPQNPEFVDNPQLPTGSPRDTATGGNPSSGTNGTQPVFESDTVICYQKDILVQVPKDQIGSTDPTGPTDPKNSDNTSIICFPKNTPQQPPVINNSNILNAGSSNNKCPDVYISTTQPNNPVIPNISINNFPDQNSNNLQKLNQNLACETNFPWWIVVLLSVSLASSLIYLNSQTQKTSSQNSKPKSVVVS